MAEYRFLGFAFAVVVCASAMAAEKAPLPPAKFNFDRPVAKPNVLPGLPSSIFDLVTPEDKGALAIAPPLTRQQVVETAFAFEGVQWRLTPTAYGADPDTACSGFSRIRRPGYLFGKLNQEVRGVPYCWGCYGSLNQFRSNIANGMLAGNVCTHNDPRPDVTGVDSSAFVSAAWGLANHFTTAAISAIARELPNAWDLQPGDALNKPGSHVMLFLRFTPDRKAEVMESSTGGCNGRVCRNIYPLASLLARGYKPVRFRALENEQVAAVAFPDDKKPEGNKAEPSPSSPISSAPTNAAPTQASRTAPASKTPDSETSSGTAFFVSKDGKALTNSHVVEGCRQISVNAHGQSNAATVLARDERNDLALLATGLHPAQAANWRLQVRQGEDIVVYGFPLTGVLASGGNVATGNVTALAGLGNDSRFLQISAPVQPGNSGGPLLDRNGAVVGIVVAKLNALRVAAAIGDIPQNVNFAIKASVAAAFLDAQRVAHAESAGVGTLSTPDIAERAQAFTVQVNCVE